MKLNWATDNDIAPFLAQNKLVEDFLAGNMDLIEDARSDAEKHAIIWCISNLVPIRQFAEGSISVVFYEELCLQPEHAIPSLFEMIGHSFDDSVFDILDQPSLSSRRYSGAITGEDRVSAWQDCLSREQIKSILTIVEAFGLGHLYGDATLPLKGKR